MVTAAPGYQVDPNNPNRVIPIGSASQQNNPNAGMVATGVPGSTPTPATQTNTPTPPPQQQPVQQPAPQQSPVTVNVGTPTTTPKPTTSTSAPSSTTPTAQNVLSMPASGSVVDLLNAQGQDSSFAARQQLATQYGIQGYTGTAKQNTDLAQKYIDAHKSLSSSKTPDTSADARTAIGSYLDENQQEPDPQQAYFDSIGSMNPVQKQIYDTISNALSSIGTQESFAQEYQDLVTQQGIPALQTNLMNINTIMDGTEDDIRNEITAVGGFATESQVQALTGARNKTLLKQADTISQQLALKQDYVNQVMSFSQADRAEVDKQVEQKLNLTSKLADLSDQMTNAAKDNYNNIIKNVGYAGLAATLKGNPQQIAKVEKLLDLAPGELKQLADYAPPTSPEDQLKLENLKLQNKKLNQDINQGPAISTQVIDVNGKKVLINSKTGQQIATFEGDTKAGPLQLATAQGDINSIDSLLSDSNLASAVGPNTAARVSLTNLFTGGKSNFLGGISQVTKKLTLENLMNAKANGATFGALSEGELALLAASATKINSWAIKDKAGNVTGYNIDEKDFKDELNKIGNFAKLDFVLKGGDPSSVGIQEQADGTFWVKNNDGTFTKLQ